MKKKWLYICLLAVLVSGVFMIVRRELGIRQSERDNADAVQVAGLEKETEPTTAPPATEPATEPPTEPEPETEPLPPLPEEAAQLADLDLEALQAENPDVVGWILIPGTEVNYPLMQGEDNQYYLDHTWKKEYSAAGSIFMECQNDPSLEGFHTLIYGHRMKNNSMFGSIKYYSKPDYWEDHPSVYIAFDGGIYRYDIFTAQEVGIREIVYYLDFEGREQDFIDFCLEHSELDTGIVPTVEDRFITLSTCTGQGHDTRWTVQAVLAQAGFDSGGAE